MGLDLLDIEFRLEKAFGIKMDAEDFESLVRDRDVVVGDLYGLILRKIHIRDTVRTNIHLNFAVWEELQEHLSKASGIAKGEILLKTMLEDIFPRDTRRVAWEGMRSASPYRIASLDYPWAVRPIGLSLAAAVVLIEQFQIWRIPGALFLWPILGIVGVWMFAESYTKVMFFFAAWRTQFPKGMKSVKDLVRSILANNSEKIVGDKQGGIVGEVEIPIDDQSVAVWRQLQEILSDALGVKAEKVTLESRMIADLGAN
jgi:acyl carrier protein